MSHNWASISTFRARFPEIRSAWNRKTSHFKSFSCLYHLFNTDGVVVCIHIFSVKPVPDFVLRVTEFDKLSAVDDVHRRWTRKRRFFDEIGVDDNDAVGQPRRRRRRSSDKQAGLFVDLSVLLPTQNDVRHRQVALDVVSGSRRRRRRCRRRHSDADPVELQVLVVGPGNVASFALN